MKKNHLIVVFYLLLNGFALQAASTIGLFSAPTLSKTTIIQGEVISLSVQLKNYGTDHFRGMYYLNMYNSNGGTIREFIGYKYDSLSAGAISNTLIFNIQNTDDWKENSTYKMVLFYQDDNDSVSKKINDGNGYNNSVSLTVIKRPFPKLYIVSDVTASKTKILEGDPFTITTKVKNDGGVAYHGAFAARTINGEEVQQLTGQTIESDSSVMLTFGTSGTSQFTEGKSYDISIYFLDSTNKWIILNEYGKTTIAVVTGISQIRWGSTNDPLNGLTLSWTSIDSSSQIKWGYSTSLEKGTFVARVRKGYDNAYFFSYQFPTVCPNATIHYQLCSSKKCTNIKTYRTAPPTDTKKFSFNVIGDSRNGLDVWKNVSQLAGSKNTAFTLFNGDIVDNGNSGIEWDGWFNAGANYLENNLIFHALGNHEESGSQTAKYYENIFELPKNPRGSELYYTTRYGNALFITLNSEAIYTPNGNGDTIQLNWLRSVLSSANNDASIKWKVISFHRPFFNIGSHQQEMDLFRSTYWKAFDDYGVDLILNGHDHNYQRSKPINLNVSSSSPVPQYGSAVGEGRCQIICGGAGAPFYDKIATAADMWAIDKFNRINHFVYAEVNDCEMNITVYSMNGSVIDNFSINKCDIAINAVGINEKSDVFNPIQVIPNPSFGLITVKCQSKQIGKGVINIYDLAGKRVLSETIEKNNELFSHECDLSRLSSGTYQLELTVNQKTDRTIVFKK
jgi:hypothetical protein